jgi:hypothetical protein
VKVQDFNHNQQTNEGTPSFRPPFYHLATTMIHQKSENDKGHQTYLQRLFCEQKNIYCENSTDFI